MYKAAVIGLGNIGFLFNVDPKRKETWSHVSAYEKCEKTELVGAVEVSDGKINLFKQQYKNVPVFKTTKELMGNLSIDIVSICTPTESHYPILKELLEYPVKGIFCEKPLASTIKEAKEMVQKCKNKQVLLAVNHTRRWDDRYLHVKKIIQDGKIGNIKAINALYPGQVFNIGTHLFDTIRMLIQENPETVSGISFNLENNDPNISGWIQLGKHIPCTVIATGKREDLIFEVDVIGTEGRVRILENGEKVELFSFVESLGYSGYRELSLMQRDSVRKNDRFIEAISDIVLTVEGKKNELSCTGEDGFYSLATSVTMLESAKNKGKPMKLEVINGC